MKSWKWLMNYVLETPLALKQLFQDWVYSRCTPYIVQTSDDV